MVTNFSSYNLDDSSLSTSSILLNRKEVAKLFHPEEQPKKKKLSMRQRDSCCKLKPNITKACTNCNHASGHAVLKPRRSQSTDVVDESTKECKWTPREIQSPTVNNRVTSNADGDLTDCSSSSKLSSPIARHTKQGSVRKSTRYIKSRRKRSTMSVVRETKCQMSCGDYSYTPLHGASDGVLKFSNTSHQVCPSCSCTKGLYDGRMSYHSFMTSGNNQKIPLDPINERSGPSLESMGIGIGELDAKGVCIPPKKSIYDAMYQQVASFKNPDVSVIIDSYEFMCHKIVLQCYSEYFEEMNGHSEVVVEGVTQRAFIAIYNWMLAPGFEGKQYIQRANILEVLIASKILVIKELENQCLAFIDSKEAFSEENAYLLFVDASRRAQKEIMELMVPRIQLFFLILVSSLEFNSLEMGDLCTILQSNYIAVHCEIEVFMSGVKWIMAKWEERSKHLVSVMKCVRFGLMTPAQLVDIRKNPMSPEFLDVTSDKTVQMMIEDGLAYSVEASSTGSTDIRAQRCELLKLKIPEPRNWATKTKEYKSYDEFLKYLAQIGNNHQMFYKDFTNGCNQNNENYQTSQLVSMSSDESGQLNSDVNLKMSMAASVRPSLIDLLYRENEKKKTAQICNEPLTANSFLQNVPTQNKTKHQTSKYRNNLFLSQHQRKKTISLRESAAIVIQSTYRGYVTRKKMKNKLTTPNTKGSKEKIIFDNMFLKGKNRFSDPGKETDEESQVLFFNRNKQGSNSPLERSSSAESNESVVSIKERPACHRPNSMNSKSTCILLLGGANPINKQRSAQEARQIYGYTLESNTWELRDKTPYPRYCNGSALLKGKLYVIGGYKFDKDHQVPSYCVDNFSYDPISHEWSQEPELITPRTNFGLVSLFNHIYAVGGQGRNNTILSSVERLDPNRKVWEEVAPIPEPTIGAAICVYKNLIWVVGGMNGTNTNVIVSKDVWCYDPRLNTWTKKPSLRFGRSLSSLATFNDNLYLVGGMAYQNGGIISNDNIDVWDDENKCWKLKGTMSLPRHGHSIAFLGSLMLIMGGVTSKNVKELTHIDSLCMLTGSRSRQISPLPFPMIGQSCVILPSSSE